jgi:hypothetical protein
MGPKVTFSAHSVPLLLALAAVAFLVLQPSPAQACMSGEFKPIPMASQGSGFIDGAPMVLFIMRVGTRSWAPKHLFRAREPTPRPQNQSSPWHSPHCRRYHTKIQRITCKTIHWYVQHFTHCQACGGRFFYFVSRGAKLGKLFLRLWDFADGIIASRSNFTD